MSPNFIDGSDVSFFLDVSWCFLISSSSCKARTSSATSAAAWYGWNVWVPFHCESLERIEDPECRCFFLFLATSSTSGTFGTSVLMLVFCWIFLGFRNKQNVHELPGRDWISMISADFERKSLPFNWEGPKTPTMLLCDLPIARWLTLNTIPSDFERVLCVRNTMRDSMPVVEACWSKVANQIWVVLEAITIPQASAFAVATSCARPWSQLGATSGSRVTWRQLLSAVWVLKKIQIWRKFGTAVARFWWEKSKE